MITVILKVDVKDLEHLQLLPGFEPFYAYFPEKEKTNPSEWGRIKTENVIFKILASSLYD